jgi:hypothetical protein
VSVALSDLQAAQAAALTQAYKNQANRDAARMAALISLYYQTRVDPTNPQAVEDWINLMVPRLIRTSDDGAKRASAFFASLRRLELGVNAPKFSPEASLGVIDEGVRKSLLTVGPYDFMNKMTEIRRLDISPQQEQALILEAKQVTAKKVAASVVRHAQAGGRQTVFDNSERDEAALGWVRVTRAKPCYFCAMLASRGIHYRAFKEGSFDLSDARFTGSGDAKVHDQCGCSLKPVYSTNDKLVDKTKEFNDLWSRWGAGGGSDAALRFRRGYEHWRDTGDFLTFEQVSAA